MTNPRRAHAEAPQDRSSPVQTDLSPAGTGPSSVGKSIFRYWLHSLTAAIYPSRCLLCDRLFHRPVSSAPLDSSSCNDTLEFTIHRFADQFVCHRCKPEITRIQPPFCTCCGELFSSREGESHLCQACCRQPRHFTTARAVVYYESLFMKAITRLKYQKRIDLAKPLGRILLFAYRTFFPDLHPDFILPVPLSKRKLRNRGFNQVFLMIRDWNRRPQTVPQLTTSRTTWDLIRKTKDTPAQAGLTRQQRIANLKNSFEINPRYAISGKKILLLDDVYTTGSTVDECARILRDNGAKQVDVLTLARTP